MAKKCSICGKKLGFLDGKIVISDGVVCTSCWASAGLDMSFRAMYSASNKTTNQIRDLIEIEILKREAAKAGLKQEIASANQAKLGERPNQPTAKQKKASPESKAKSVEKDITKPVDIILAVDANKGVGFACEGKPVINFDDLINGREMIIGDGFIHNESNEALPEIRIVCEFEPPIIDAGLIYYEAGTFAAGAEGRFEIDDPPINLEEYAKIKRTRNGKFRLTMFLGEQEIHTEECGMKIKPAPAEDMQKLMNAVMYEEEKNASGPVNIFLYARETGSYDIDLMRNPELLYSMYSNGKEQIIGDVFVTNELNHALNNVQFEARYASDILSPVDVLLGNVPAGENISFEVDDPAIDVEKLEMLTEIESCTATYRILVDGRPVAESIGRITICPYNQWNAALILLPAYMTPNHPNIISVLQNASQWMLVNGMNPSLEGYQSDARRVEEMVKAVYHAVKEANIIYSNPPASFFGPQRIRLCETVFEQKFATCMDMTILFASCLESFGLHPVLITAPGHIFAGVWLTATGRLQEPVISDAKLIQKHIKEKKLVAIECTAMNAGKDTGYDKAKQIASNTIKDMAENDISDHECIDVQIVRAIGVRPLPMRMHRPAPADALTAVEGTPFFAEKTALETKNAVPKKPVASEEAIKEVSNDEPGIGTKQTANSVRTYYTKEAYQSFDKDLADISIDNFYDKQSKKIIKNAIVEIVAVEGPISQPSLIRVIINKTSLGRASKQITEHLDKLVAAADVKITRQNGIRFLWSQGTEPSQYTAYRMKEQRPPDEICKYELKNAVCYLIQENGPMAKEEIGKDMVRLLGYNRSSKKIEDGAAAAIKAAKELKAIRQNEERNFVLA